MLGESVAPAADADEQLGTLFTGMGAWFHASIDRTIVTFWSTPRPASPRTSNPKKTNGPHTIRSTLRAQRDMAARSSRSRRRRCCLSATTTMGKSW